MPSKREAGLTTLTFEFNLNHCDVIDMMNDEDVLLDNGNVSKTQQIEISIKKLNGTEKIVGDINAGDVLTMRFRKTNVSDEVTQFCDVDVIGKST